MFLPTLFDSLSDKISFELNATFLPVLIPIVYATYLHDENFLMIMMIVMISLSEMMFESNSILLSLLNKQ